jgi:hypothetical protein
MLEDEFNLKTKLFLRRKKKLNLTNIRKNLSNRVIFKIIERSHKNLKNKKNIVIQNKKTKEVRVNFINSG